jgi:hypothetical protein
MIFCLVSLPPSHFLPCPITPDKIPLSRMMDLATLVPFSARKSLSLLLSHTANSRFMAA